MPQSEEHLAALHALGVRHVLVVISKADLADPGPAIEQVRRAACRRAVVLGTDLDQVRAELVSLVDRLPPPDRDADVRLWVDRSFTVRGAGTVVTGTLAAGTIRVGDELEHAGRRVTVRGSAVAGTGPDGGGRGRARRGEPAGRRPSSTSAAATPCGRPAHGCDTAEIDVALRAAGRAAPPTRAAHRFGGGAGARAAAGHGGAAAADAAAAVARRRHRAAARPRRAPHRRGHRGARRASAAAASPRRGTRPGRRTGDRPRRTAGMRAGE